MSGIPIMELAGKKPLTTLSNCRSIIGPHANSAKISSSLHNALALHVAVNNYFRHCFSSPPDSSGLWDFAPKCAGSKEDKQPEGKQKTPRAALAALPPELVSKACSFLGARELLLLSETGRAMRRLVRRSRYSSELWRALLVTHRFVLPRDGVGRSSSSSLVLVGGKTAAGEGEWYSLLPLPSEEAWEEKPCPAPSPPSLPSSSSAASLGKDEKEEGAAAETPSLSEAPAAAAEAEAAAAAEAAAEAAYHARADCPLLLHFRACHCLSSTHTCLACRAAGAVVPCVYGFPSPALLQHFHTRKLRFGGDYLMPGLASWSCLACDEGFYSHPWSVCEIRCAEPESQHQLEGYSRKIPWSFGFSEGGRR